MLALATYMSYGVCLSQFGPVCWQPTGLMGCVGASFGAGNLHVLWELVCGCMLATYRSYVACLSQFGAVCWQPTGLMGCVEPVWGCMLAT